MLDKPDKNNPRTLRLWDWRRLALAFEDRSPRTMARRQELVRFHRMGQVIERVARPDSPMHAEVLRQVAEHRA